MNRRHFVKSITSSAVGAGLSWPAFHALGPSRPVPPSDQVRVGVIGVGSRGQWMMQHLLRVPGMQIVALCDVYDVRFAEGREITGEATPVFEDYRTMLDDVRDMDAILVASPLHLHGEHMVGALDRGLHVYGEKTMAFTLEESNAIVDAVRRSGRVFQVGHQYRYAPNYQIAFQRVKEGAIGKVTHVYGYWHRNNNWRRPVPDPSLERLINWRMYLDSSRGLLAELGSHHIDITNLVFDALPESVMGTGGITYYDDGRETYDNVQAIFTYPGQRKLIFSSLLGNHKTGFQIWIVGTGGTLELTLEDATFYYEPWRPNSAMPEDSPRRAVETGPTLGTQGDMPYRGRGERVEVPDELNASGDQLAVQDFVESIRENRRPFADERVGWSSAVPVYFGHQAIRQATSIAFDEHTRAFQETG